MSVFFGRGLSVLADVLLSFCVLIIMIIIVCAKSLFNAVSLLKKKKTYLNSIIHMCVTWYQSNKKITNEQKSIKQVLKKKNRGNKQSII